MAASRVLWMTLPRSVLGVLKRFAVYLPPGYHRDAEPYPVLYLFRGHETEWLGRQDRRKGLVRLLDRAIATERVQPMIVVMPGFMDASREHQGIPVNWSEDGRELGVGNGRFEDHFFEVKTTVERELPVRIDRFGAALDGFSMGGYSSILLAVKYPRLFGSAGAYDGSFMWPGQIDPRLKPFGRACKLWFSETCSPYFRRAGVWDRVKMERHNPIAWIESAVGETMRALKGVRFHIRCAGSEEAGNVDRGLRLDRSLEHRGLANSFRGASMIFHEDARHDWSWADRHLEETIELHDASFRRGLEGSRSPRSDP